VKRKMALLEQAHGLLCNAPGDGGSAEDGEEWHRQRAEWIERWTHVIRDQRTKEHNARVAIGNEAIARYDVSSFASDTVLRTHEGPAPETVLPPPADPPGTRR
jgi:hypothetical protein